MQKSESQSESFGKNIEHPTSNNLSVTETLNSSRPFPLRPITAGSFTILLFLICLSVWMAMAPIEGAVVSPGIVGVSSHRKVIQHLEGGIVEKILVQDGYRVKQGQLLVQLRSVQQTSELNKLERQLLEAQAVMARLFAEINNHVEINFPDEITLHADEESVKSVIVGQQNILTSLRALNSDKRSVLESKIAQAEEEIYGLTERIKAKRRQRSYIDKELDRTLEAITKKLIPETRAFSLHERLAEVDGEISEYHSKITMLEQSIDELSIQISEAKAQYLSDISEQLRKQQALVFDLSQKIISARDILHRTKILSPIDGIVVNLQIHTQNGVVAAGKPILEIVPINDDFVVHAFINPKDIDEVRTGMSADVRLTSVNRRQRLPMSGIVTDISADRLTNHDSGQDYYLVRIDLDPEVYSSEKDDLIPGMGADVFILTGSRTPLDYLLSPIANSFQLGMREQ